MPLTTPSTSPALLLSILSACVAGGAEPGAVAARAPALAAPLEAPSASGAARFGAPRAPDRGADPLPAGAAVRFDAPLLGVELTPSTEVRLAEPGVLVELQHNAGHLGRCWEQRAAAGARGRVTIHAQVGPEGFVVEQCITEDTVGDPALVQCVNELIAMGRYPKPGAEPVSVVVPIHFGPAGGPSAG